MAAAWEPILEHVPTEDLMPAYLKAMRSHKEGPFGAYEIDGGYDALCEERSAKVRVKREEEERRLRRRRDEDIPMPPQVKAAIGKLLDRWDANLKRRPDDPPLPPLEIEIPDAPPSTNTCNSCFGSGWAAIKRTDPVTGLPGSATRPCECPEGDKYQRSYRAATEASV